MDKLLLTPEEAALALSIGRSKLYELLADGSLGSVNIGACRRVPVQVLEEFVKDLDGSAPTGRELTPGTLEASALGASGTADLRSGAPFKPQRADGATHLGRAT